MPDIVSRIRIEAQGADQAAREVRKLKEAYDQVSESARNLSPEGTGGGDPFAKATAAGGRAIEGGNAPADVARRESRERNYRDLVNQRERSNQQYNAPMRRGGMGGITQGFSTAEAMEQGRGGAATGGIMSGLGGMLGGPLGLGLAGAGLAAMGVQRMADSAFERLERVFGSGMSQRMGIGARQLDTQMLDWSTMGIPQGMMQGFFQAAGTSGVNFGRPSTQGGINAALFASSMLGVDPNTAAGLIGSLNRANVNAGNVSSVGMFSMANQTFGRPNVSMFTQGLQGMVETMSMQGIEQSTGTTMGNATMMGALAQIGGFAPQGASRMAAQLQNRGIQAAQVQRPEDVVAFQAMRESGASVTDTMLAMERDPRRVNRAVFNYLRQATGGNQDLFRMRVQSYLGEGTTMSAADRFITTMRETEGLSEEEIQARLGAGNQDWRQVAQDEEGKYVSTNETIRVFQVRQNQMLKEAKDQMLAITTGAAEIMLKMFGRDLEFNPMRYNTEEGYVPDFSRQIEEGLRDVNEITIQDVSNATIAIEEAEFTSRREMENALRFLEDPRMARATSAAQTLRESEPLRNYVGGLFERTGGYGSRWNEFMESYESGEGTLEGAFMGGFAEMRDEIIDATLSQIGKEEGRGASNQLATALQQAFPSYPSMPSDITLQRMVEVLEKFERVLREEGFVYTDGDWTYQGE